MDLSKLKTSDWLLTGGGLGFLIFGLLKWFTISTPIGSLSENAFDYFFTGTLPWILIVGSGVVTLLVAGGALRTSAAPWPIVLLGATGLGTLLVFLRVVFGREIGDVELSRAYGIWLSLAAGIVATAGAVMKFTESGGAFRDLTDVDRLRGAFDRSDREDAPPPPPPPPPAAPPPPPPPAGGAEPPLPPPGV